MGTLLGWFLFFLPFHHLALVVCSLQLYLAEQGYQLLWAISYQLLMMSTFPFSSSWSWLRFFFQESSFLPFISFLFGIFLDKLSLLLL